MKRFSWIWIVLLTFAFGITATAIWVKFHFREYTFEEVAFADVPKTDYCDLVNNPYKYDGEIVRVNAKLYWFMHGFYLADENCKGNGDELKTSISFKQNDEAQTQKYIEKFRQSEEFRASIEIIAKGVFKYKFRTGGSDSIEDRTRLHFEIYEIEYSSR